MSLGSDRPVLGYQVPRLHSVPKFRYSAGRNAIDLSAMAGLFLDPWQELVMEDSMGVRDDERWASFENGLVVPRQNGKGGILECRELGGLFLWGEQLIIHSAHQFDTSFEAFQRMLILIESVPEFDRRIKKVTRSNGEEGFELHSGQRLRYRTRTGSGGRGFTGDCIIFDEAMHISRAMIGAVLPVVSARTYQIPGPQVWYTGSAVDEEIHPHGVVFSRIRKRGIDGDPSLAFFEWSPDYDEYFRNPRAAMADPDFWARANPALGIRIAPEHVGNESRSMDLRTFSTERLSIGHWPRTDDEEDRVIPRESWEACGDDAARCRIEGTKFFAVDVSPDRSRASLTVSGRRPDGKIVVEVVDNKAGTAWIAQRCADIKQRRPDVVFIVDPRSPAATVIRDLGSKNIVPLQPTTQEYARACGDFYDEVMEHRLRFPAPQPEIDTALGAAAIKPAGEAWTWSRKSPTDITPLVSATLALWGVMNEPAKKHPRILDLAAALERGERLAAERAKDG